MNVNDLLQRRELLALLLAEEGVEARQSDTIPRREDSDRAPLSFSQQRLWFLHQLDAQSPAHNLSMAVRCKDALDVRALERSFGEIVRRHETLQTVFTGGEEEPAQVILPAGDFTLPVLDLSALPPAERETEARRLAGEDGKQPFDLERGPLMRARLLRLGERDHILLICMHHIVGDGWSTGVLTRELMALYGAFSVGAPSPLEELPIQYADFAQWQRDWMQGEVLDRELSYWKSRLPARPAPLQLATDRPRPAVQTYNGAVRSLTLSADCARALKRLSRQEDVTLFMTLLAAFNALLHRYTGQDDILVGSPIANRNRKEVEGLIGFFVNTLVLRSDLSGDPTFRELLGRVRAQTLGAYEHQDLPFEKLVDALQPERDLMRTPLFQVCFVLQNAPLELGGDGGPGLKLIPVEGNNPTAKFDLTLIAEERGGGLTCSLEYNTDLFDEATADRMLRHYEALLESAVRTPSLRASELLLLTPEERRLMLRDWNDTRRDYPAGFRLHELFERQAERTPDARALTFEGAHLTYAELNRRANQLARRLRALGVGAESLVCVCVERSTELVVALLAVLKAGGAYVPLDPSYPHERLAFMLEDSGASVLLTQRRLLDSLPPFTGEVFLLDDCREALAAEPGGNLPSLTGEENLAYMIYTSGSTGRPKGAMNTHRAICNRLLWMQEAYGLGADDVVLQKTPFSFDVSVWEFFWPLLAGARLVVARPGGHKDCAYLSEVINAESVTTIHFVPSMLHAFVEVGGPQECPGLRRVICSGEALPFELQERFHGQSGAELHNLYGPTEAAVDVTYWACRRGDASTIVPIGRPISNIQLYIVDRHMRPVPVGVAGELLIGGVGLARGYFGRAGLTAERFIPDPFSPAAGQRVYRTGDLARYLPSGEIEYLGRLDHQVKLRGFRIELGEIEAVLSSHPRVGACAVVVHAAAGHQQLAAYVVAGAGATPPASELRGHLKQRLPDYMLPAQFVFLDALPLTENGKLDRRALPGPDAARPELEESYLAPRNELEEVLAAVWSKVLGLERVGVNDNFFAVGGDSIRSIQVIALAGKRGLNISLPQLFQHQTIAELASVINDGSHPLPDVSGEPFSLLPEEDRQKLPDDVVDAYPITMLQAGMLFHMELTPGVDAYVNVNSIHLGARFDLDKFREAVGLVVARHPIMRTSFDFTSYSEPLQLVHETASLPIGVSDIRHLPADEQGQVLDAFVAEEVQRPFDLSRPPLLRFHFHLCDEESFYFTLKESHAIFDGWSLHSTLNEIFNLYFALLNNQAPPAAPPLSSSFRDFVALERKALGSAEFREFWDERLKNHTPLELPSWPRTGPSAAGRRIRVRQVPIHAQLSEGLRRLAVNAAVPLKSVLLAAHLKVLSTVSGQDDIITGTTSHGRPERADGEQIRGLFLNTLPFRLRLSGGTWLELIRETFDVEREMIPYRRYPLAQLQRERPGRPLFEVNFNFINFHVVGDLLQSGDVQAGEFKKIEETNFKLVAGFGVDPVSAQLGFELHYDSEAFSDEQVEAWAGYYQTALGAMVADPSAHHHLRGLLSAEEQHARADWNDTRADYGDELFVELFERQAAQTPEATALVCGDERLSYRELNRQANQLAHYLRAFGIGPESRVGIMLGRSVEAVVALLGVLKAGGAYLPLDPSYPQERLAFMIEDASVHLLLTEQKLMSLLPEVDARVLFLDTARQESLAAWSGENPATAAGPDNLAYLIYTSGSTGRPKGVMIHHRGLANYLRWATDAYQVPRGQGAPVHSSLSFDLTVTGLFTPLLAGRAVTLLAEERGVESLAAALQSGDNFSLVKLTPAHLKVLEQSLSPEAARRCAGALVIGGEALFGEDLRFWQEHGSRTRLVNEYGPTETVVGCCTYEVEGGREMTGGVPIGRPIANMTLYVLDGQMNPAPVGTPGELYIGGVGVARGYFNRPGLTAEKFVPDPFDPRPGQRLYRTGDVARYLPDGLLEFLCRNDEQVKVRGYRIEIGEIEAVLRGHEDVAEATVVARQDGGAEKRLVAYVVARHGAELSTRDLRSWAQAKLPDYMIPSQFVTLDAVPLTPSGKVDRRALPAPAEARKDTAREYVAPRNEIEELVAAQWAEVLTVERVGVHDDFFELGGHSLSAAQLVYSLYQNLGVKPPMRAIFDEPTVAGQALVLEELLIAELEGLSEDEVESLT